MEIRPRARALWLLTVGLICMAAPGAANCQMLLNEVVADPARDWDGNGVYNLRDDEWVEIVNAGAEEADLSQVFLADESGGFVYGFSGSLAPGDVRVVFGSESVVWEQSHGESATGLRLGNDGDTVTLWQVSEGDTLLLDAYSYNTQEAEDDRSTGRNPDGGATWEIFDAFNPYGGQGPPAGNGLPPTPGARNDGSEEVPVAESTWGRVKTLFQS